MDVKELQARRDALQRQIADLEARVGVYESKIDALCKQLGLSGVPTGEELESMISQAEGALSVAESQLSQQELELDAWHARYTALVGGASGSGLSSEFDV